MSLARDEFVEPLELGESDGRLKICHSEIPTELFMHEPARRSETEISERAAMIGERIIVGNNHSAFAGGNVLVRIKAERREITKRSAWTSAICLTDHLRCVFQDLKIVTLRHVEHRIHVHGKPIEMDNHDCFRFLPDASFH